ncbi:MAG TPA: EAL domain-containing protein [Gemmatimonadales bacterium]|jgi:diguanylate cyclase (GGDEF)-like protein|nr:EAL domain-containing protein [Gemmatimonadales bacterium]
MPQHAAVLDNAVGSSRRLLRSRLGRRLLGLFIGCALVPTCTVALLSFKSVTKQLTRQSQERLTALAGAAGKTLVDRLSFFESDLRRQAPKLLACATARASSAHSDCGDVLLYAAEGVGAFPGSGAGLRLLSGEAAALRTLTPAMLPKLGPGQSTLVSLSSEPAALQLYVVHRPETTREVLLIAHLSTNYLWGPADAEGLPGNVALRLQDAQSLVLLGSPSDNSASLTAAWSLPRLPLFLIPSWQVVLSEPRADVIAPITGFARSFPAVLALALLAVVLLSLSQIRRSLVPLVELGKGTRRIAAGDFHTSVQVTSGDELEELGGAFNAMTGKLARQFHTLETAAEIDRAILSSMDTATIAEAVLDRVPEVCPCQGLSLTVLGPEGEAQARTWWERGRVRESRAMIMAQLSASDLVQTLQQPEWMILGEEGIPVPGYLAHLGENGKSSVVACPLHYGGELLGVLALCDAPGERSNETLLDFRRLADRVAVALSNARMMDQVRVLAFFDSLTRLPNRILYRQRLGQAIGHAATSRRRVAVCVLDLDQFARINDTLGHDLGDQLIQEVALRLQGSCRQEGAAVGSGTEALGIQVARLGGDEFAVILPELGEAEEALWAARRLLEAFQQPFRLGAQEVFATASIGIAVYPDDGNDPETLHKNADVALTHAKEEGRNTAELYSASMNGEALGRMRLEHELRKAVEHGEFTVWYQPIVELRSRLVTGAEALVRWEHPDRGLVGPLDFIALCEESGLIVPLGEWILRDACDQLKRWREAGLDGFKLSVNLSARQLRQRGIVRTIQDILDSTGVRPSALAFELTESLLMEQGGTTERRIRELAELGVTLAIDDFGTGYSSLSYLKNFPVSTLKIDRSFIVDVTTSPDAAAITTAIIALARAMELDVIAEGVETKGQAAFLRDRGCQKVQGYLFGRPAPRALFTDFLLARQRRRVSA